MKSLNGVTGNINDNATVNGRGDFIDSSTISDATKIGNESNKLAIYANNGGAEIETTNDTRIRFNNQVRWDSNNFNINTPPIVLRNVEEDDSPGSKGSIIEWQQYFTTGNKTVGISTQEYWDWIRGGSVGSRPTFNVAGTGTKRVCWVMSHYDSPSTTGEDIHQHFNIETCMSDISTLITRLQISYGEDVALVSFPNSNVQVFDDKKLYLSSNSDVHFVFNSADQFLQLISDLTKIGNNTSDVLIDLAGQNDSATSSAIRFSENSGTPKNGISIVYDSIDNQLEFRNDATSTNVAIFYRDGGLNVLGNRVREVATPTTGTDAANKDYVDSILVGIKSGATQAAAGAAANEAWKTSGHATLPDNVLMVGV